MWREGDAYRIRGKGYKVHDFPNCQFIIIIKKMHQALRKQ